MPTIPPGVNLSPRWGFAYHPRAMRRALVVASLFVTSLPSIAMAQSGGCEPDAAGCTRAAIAYHHREGLPVEFDFDTDWLPRGAPVQVRVRAVLAGHTDVRAAGELVGSWPEPMILRAIGTPGEGSLEVDYGVQFSARVRLSLPIEGRTVGWEGNIPYVPMIDFRATARNTFDPWAWERVSVMGRTMRNRVADVPLTDAIIRIPGISGGFTFEASGEVSASYQSTRFTFGLDADPLTAMTLRTQARFNAGPFVEYQPRLEGDLGYAGAIHVYPGLYVSLAGRRWTLDLVDLPIPIGPFPRHVLFDPAVAHLPLPDVQATMDSVDFGDIDVGRMTERTVEIVNTGEAAGRVLGAAVDAPFGVATREGSLPARSRSSFVVSFAPVRPGPATGDLVITTNDPDTPRVHVRLRANGVAPYMPPVEEDAGLADVVDASTPTSAAQDGGCGCRASGAPAEGGVAGWGAVFFAAALARRSRRRDRRAS